MVSYGHETISFSFSLWVILKPIQTLLWGQWGYLINDLPCVCAIRDTKSKFEIKTFDQFVLEIMSFNHSKIWNLFCTNTELEAKVVEVKNIMYYLVPIDLYCKKAAPKSYLMKRVSSGKSSKFSGSLTSASAFTWNMIFAVSVSLILNCKNSIPYVLALMGHKISTKMRNLNINKITFCWFCKFKNILRLHWKRYSCHDCGWNSCVFVGLFIRALLQAPTISEATDLFFCYFDWYLCNRIRQFDKIFYWTTIKLEIAFWIWHNHFWWILNS